MQPNTVKFLPITTENVHLNAVLILKEKKSKRFQGDNLQRLVLFTCLTILILEDRIEILKTAWKLG